ncbi:MAG: C39 family peptidase [Butyricicoccus sp.]|nr:C39 family peptidase [Butyricicoccus sp.]
MEKTTRRRSRLWLVPLTALVLVCAAAVSAVLAQFGLIGTSPSAPLAQLAASRGAYLYCQGLLPAPGSQLAGEPVISDVEPVSDPAVTSLVTSGEGETLTGGFIPVTYFCQADERWCELPFGTDTIGPYGCGPTALAMAVSSMTGETVDPEQMAQRAFELGCWAKGHGSWHSIVNIVAADFGLASEGFEGRDADSLINALVSGKLLVALMGPGHFTDGGHFILLRGVTLSGEILVADPNSRERSLTAWDPEIILSELSPATDNGSPLWVLSEA